MVRHLALCAALACPPGLASAHPHIFVETGLRLIHDAEGRLTALEVTWVYDELFSLLLLEDMGLDADVDGVLTADETARLQGFDMDWPEDYEGDVYASADGQPLALAPPVAGRAELDGLGRLIGRHTRALAAPIDPRAAELRIQVYDPTYYTAYEIPLEMVATEAEGCRTEVFAPDRAAVVAELDAALAELLGRADADPEAEFPRIGARFAEEVRLICDGGT